MADNSPSPPDRKRGLIAPLVIAGFIGALVLVAFLLQPGRAPAPETPPAPAAASAPVAKTPSAPLPPPALTREDLIDNAAAASAAFAAAAPAPAGADPLVRREFRVRLPFGCAGPQAVPGASQAWFEQDLERRTVKLTARTIDWSGLPLIRSLPNAEAIETVEGFWIPRPWLRTDTCPPRREIAPAPTPTAAAAQSLGLAQISGADASRLPRRDGRPYEFVQKLPAAGAPAGAGGYHLVLEGRIAAFPDGRSIRCWSETPDHRPVCLYAVDLERVAFEDGKGAVLAEWRE